MFFLNEESLKKFLSQKYKNNKNLPLYIGLAICILVFLIIRLYYGKIFSSPGFLYLYLPFFIIKSLVLSFGNLFFFTLLYYITAGFFSGKASFKKIYFCVSISAIPIIILLITLLPELFIMKEDLFNFIPKKSPGIIFSILHIILFLIRVFLMIISIYITILSLKIIHKYSMFNAIMNYFTGAMIPFIIFFALFLYLQNILIKFN